ncbi:MAG: tRNA (guanosine(37)-N1)-methyltransferase TrmD, partial [Patescibacteria group bacterium]
MLHFHIITLFPESIEPYLKSSILGRAIKKKLIKVSYYDPKKFTRNPVRDASRSNGAGKYGRVDQR